MLLSMKFFSKVDKRRESEDCNRHQDEEEAELLVGLLEGVEQRLEASEVADELIHSQDPHHLDQPDYLPGFANNFKILCSNVLTLVEK